MNAAGGQLRACHYVFVTYSSMGSRVGRTCCVIDESFLNAFISPEEAMKREAGVYGWWTDNAKWVDCPECIAKLPEWIAPRLELAQKEARTAIETVERLAAEFKTACEKRRVQEGGE